MKNLEPFQLQEAVFVFLHGPEAYPQGGWEPVLLDVLHEVGFTRAKKLLFEKQLNSEQCIPSPEGVIGGGQRVSESVPFGVAVLEESSERSLVVNIDATLWLDQISSSITMCRLISTTSKQRSREEALKSFKTHGTALNASGLLKSAGQSERFSSDPKTTSEYEAVHQNPPDGFDEFEIFLPKAKTELADLLEESRALEPIVLTEFEDIFIQASPPGLHRMNLRDEMVLQSGRHDVCGGVITFRPTSKTNLTVMCSECPLNIRLARSTYSTFAQLRELGEKIRQR